MGTEEMEMVMVMELQSQLQTKMQTEMAWNGPEPGRRRRAGRSAKWNGERSSLLVAFSVAVLLVGAARSGHGQPPRESPGATPPSGEKETVPPNPFGEPHGELAPEQGPPEQGAPEQGAPEQGAPEQGAPEQGAPEQEPPASRGAIDLFTDAPDYPAGFFRLGSWNVRHLEVEPGSAEYFPGDDRERDAADQVAGFAKAITDLRLDLVVLVELQPRSGEPDRLVQLREALNRWPRGGEAVADRIRAISSSLETGPWRSTQTRIEYDEPEDPHGNLQFGLLWNASRGVRIDPHECQVLEELRQPQAIDLGLQRREQRAPWLVPVRVRHGSEALEFDLLALHLKSGGASPQAAEVESIARFIRGHQTRRARRESGAPSAFPGQPDLASPRHLIVCGDWNIRPDENSQGRGRSRLRKLCCPAGDTTLLRLLTAGDIPPNLDEWDSLEMRLGDLAKFPALGRLLPYSRLAGRESEFDSLLDHVAISRSLEEVFDHPLRVAEEGGPTDLRPGIEIAVPRVSRADYLHFTDHLPLVVTLRIQRDRPTERPTPVRIPPLRIAAVLPNPIGDERFEEAVTLHNQGTQAVSLAGWRLQNRERETWFLDGKDTPHGDGSIPRGGRVTILRRDRPMGLSNSGDSLALFNDQGDLVDVWVFGGTATAERLQRAD